MKRTVQLSRIRSAGRKLLTLTMFGLACWPWVAQPAQNTGVAGVLRTGTIQNGDITESSGLVASRQYPGVLWTHNDSGNQPVLYAITQAGKSLGSYTIIGAAINDWESIAADSSGNLYLADIGDNNGKRKRVAVHRLREPNPGSSGSALIQQTWRLEYPGDPMDAECFFVAGGNGFILSKERKKDRATLFRFPLSQAKSIKLQQVAKIKIGSSPAGADLSRDNRKLAVVTDKGVYMFAVNGKIGTAGTVKPMFVRFNFSGMEGAAFAGNGLAVSSESRALFLFNGPAFRTW